MAFEAVNVAIFEHLQSKIDEDSQVREELKGILHVLEKEGIYATLQWSTQRTYIQYMQEGQLSRYSLESIRHLRLMVRCFLFHPLHERKPHPDSTVGTLVAETEKSILEQAKTIAALATFASSYPYYKYNSIWTRDIQNTVYHHSASRAKSGHLSI